MLKETKEPDQYLKMLWDLNDKYPDFVHCVIFDHASPPQHDLPSCIRIFKAKMENDLNEALTILADQIEDAQDNGETPIDLITLRKKFKSYRNMQLDFCASLDEILSNYPEDLKIFLSKK